MTTHITDWSGDAELTMREAIGIFDLRKLGWRNFEALDWVAALRRKYPAIMSIAINCSAINGCKLDEVTALFEGADVVDRPIIRNYFIAKMALEKLSCALSGPAAGMCDKLGAFMAIFEHTKRWCA